MKTGACLVVLLSLGAGLCAGAERSAPKPQILFLNSYHHGYRWSDDLLSGFERELEERGVRPELYVEYLDAKRFPLDKEALAGVLRTKYRATRIDVVVSSDDDALAFIGAEHDRLFPRTPVVFCGVRYPEELLPAGSRLFTGLEERLSILDTARLVTRFHPQVRKLFVVTDNSTAGISQNREARADLDGVPGLEVAYLDGRDLRESELFDRIRALPQDAALLAITWQRDREGRIFDARDSFRRICAASSVPVYGTGVLPLGEGIVGGRLNVGSLQGRASAAMVAKILAGATPASIPIARGGQNAYQFDFVQLQRWGIPLSALPAHSLVVNRPQSFYEQHRTVFWVSAAIIVFQAATIAALAVSIVRRRRTAEALRESRKMYKTLVETAPDSVILVDERGRIVYASPRAVEMHGLGSAAAAGGRSLYDLVEPKECDAARAEIERLLRSGGSCRSEHRFVRGEGGGFDGELNASAIPAAAGHPGSVMVTVADVTERKLLHAQLLRSQRLESLGALAGGIAHDLNNVLAPILVSVDHLKREYTAEADRRMLLSLEASAERGARIIRQLLTFARGAKGGQEIIQPDLLVRDVEGIVRTTFPKSIEVHVEVEPGLWAVKGDPTQLHQVLVNLCLNARDAMEAGGCLRVHAANVLLPEEREPRTSGAGPGRFVALTVTDTGCGIPRADLQRIFDPFFTTKAVGKGTGLGLATVSKIVKSHGGLVNVESEVGRGSCFTVHLPAESQASPITTPVATPTAGTARGHGETVLVIDDEPAVREVTCKILRAAGYTAVAAASGEEGVAAYRAAASRIAVVITDILMPGMSGAGVVREIRKIDRDARIIAVTGLAQHPEAEELRRLDHTQILEKPYGARVLLRAIRDALAPDPASVC